MLVSRLLMDRKQYIATILGSSDFRNIHCGLPQRSVLGPLLFLLYTLTICPLVAIIQTFVFLRTIQQCFSNCEFLLMSKKFYMIWIVLNSLKEWFDENRLAVNESNCKLDNFWRYHEENISVFGYPLKWQKGVKYIGVLVAQKMDISNHIKHVVNQLNRFCGLVYLSRTFLTKKQLHKFYRCKVEPTIRYALIVYGATTKTN